MRAADSAADSGVAMAPSCSNSGLSSADAAISLNSRLSRSTSAAGVPAGANTATQISIA